MKKWVLLLLCIITLPLSAQAETSISQRTWMEQLVLSLGWSFGLPDKPQDVDYIRLLGGVRRLRVEAEDSRQPDDAVSVKSFSNFGTFSGSGWVSGISTPTQVHLRFILPHAGRYRIGARVRLAGHRLELAGESFVFDGHSRFTLVELGEVELDAGENEIIVTLPPGGGIDYVELFAPPLGPISPAEGWQPELPLTATDVARTLVQAFGLQGLLPPSGRRFNLEAESRPHPGLNLTTVRHMGLPSGGGWLRARNRPATLNFSLLPPAPGCYSLRLRALGTVPLEVAIVDLFTRRVDFEPYLSEQDLGSFFLPQDGLELSMLVPAEGGVDRLELVEQRSDAAALKRLVGLPVDIEQLSESQVNDLLALVARLAGLRHELNRVLP